MPGKLLIRRSQKQNRRSVANKRFYTHAGRDEGYKGDNIYNNYSVADNTQPGYASFISILTVAKTILQTHYENENGKI
jgi:hypothetical protein